MKGDFEYIDKHYKLCQVDDSDLIPLDACELVKFKYDVPPEPHTQADHDTIERMTKEFMRIKDAVYGGRS